MPVYWLDERIRFPNPQLADVSGILAVGGDLSIQRLLLAYEMGIFPWYDEEASPILWHAPHERFVITPKTFRFGRSIKKLVTRHQYQLTYDVNFRQVIEQCARVPRDGQDGTWLGIDMLNAYCDLHEAGYAHSAEAYLDGRLIGGLYGVSVGGAFFGESMFSLQPGVSKIVFALLAPKLFELGYELIDCQMYTPHLARFGAQSITSSQFYDQLSLAVKKRLARSWPRTSSR